MKKILKTLITLFAISVFMGIFNVVYADSIKIEGETYFEAENADYIGHPMYVEPDTTASGGKFVLTSAGTSSTTPVRGTVNMRYNIKTTEDDGYFLWAKVRIYDTAANTFSADFDDGVFKMAYACEDATENPGEWVWCFIDKFYLFEGEHQLNIRYRVKNVQFDEFLITNDFSFTPEGASPSIVPPDEIYQRDENGNVKNLYYNLPSYLPPDEHPRLLFRKKDIERIKANLTHPQNIAEYNALQNDATYQTDGESDVQRQDETCGEDVAGNTGRDNAVQMVGAGEEGIGFRQAVKHQRTESDHREDAEIHDFAGGLETESVQIQDHAGTDDGPAGEAAAGGEVTVEDDVNAEEQNDGHQQSCAALEDHVVLGFVMAVVRFGCDQFFRRNAGLVMVNAQQRQNRTGSDKQYGAFAQRIKGTIIQNHAGNDVDGAGFCHTLFNVAGGNFIVDRGHGIAVGRHVQYHDEHENGYCNAYADTKQSVKPGGHLGAARHAPAMDFFIYGMFFLNCSIMTVFLAHLPGIVGSFFIFLRLLVTAFGKVLFHGVIQHGNVFQPCGKPLLQGGFIAVHLCRSSSFQWHEAFSG